MTEEARNKRCEYQKKYRQTHREQVNAYRRKYYEENKEKVLAWQAKYWAKVAQQ